MTTIGIEFDCDEETARNRVHKEGIGEVTENGNYYREADLPMSLYELIVSMAEDDDQATVTKLKL